MQYIKIIAGVIAVLMVVNFVLLVFQLVSPLTFWVLTAIFGIIAYKGIPWLRGQNQPKKA